MLAVVKTPLTSIEIRGKIPSPLLRVLKREYGKVLTLEKEPDDELVNFFETSLYDKTKAGMMTGDYLRIYRNNKAWSQTQLGTELGISKAYVCDLEKGRRPISKAMAQNFAKLFHTSVERFI